MKPGQPGRPGGVGGLLRDKRVLIGAAAAVGLGLVALLRRGGAVDGGAQIQPAANIDSSGTDLYNALQQFNDGLTDIRDLLEQQPATGTGSNPGTGTPKPVPITPPKPPGPRPAPKPTPRPGPSKLYTRAGTWGKSVKWSTTLSGIASHYHTSVGALLKLNPSIKNANLIHAGQQIRYR